MANSEENTLEISATSKSKLIEEAVKTILENVGENTDRKGLIKTPRRVAKMYAELLEGYSKDLKSIVNGALYDVEYGQDEMIIIDNIQYQSMCEHHMLPFTGKAHVAYIPRDKIIGLSKIPRIVDMFARRLQVQERLTNQIADAIDQVLDSLGVMVMIEGHHMCASLRGVKKSQVNMKTIALRNEFKEKSKLRKQFFDLIKL